MDMEIAGHEFFGQRRTSTSTTICRRLKARFSGWPNTISATGKMTKYGLTKHEWSVHYGVSPDGEVFSGDGGGPNSVARGDNGQWIYLFHPKDDKFESEKLVNLAKHDYTLEPNATFTP